MISVIFYFHLNIKYVQYVMFTEIYQYNLFDGFNYCKTIDTISKSQCLFVLTDITDLK